jgi:hypothetical protein
MSVLMILLSCAARSGATDWRPPEGAPPGSMTCVAKKHPELTYTAWQKSGGAMPGPETPMGGESWTWGDAVLFSRTLRYGVDGETEGSLEWAWDHSRAARLSLEQQGMSRTEVYRTAVTLWRPDGSALVEGISGPLTVTVTCTRQEVWGIP